MADLRGGPRYGAARTRRVSPTLVAAPLSTITLAPVAGPASGQGRWGFHHRHRPREHGSFQLPGKDYLVFYGNEDARKSRHVLFTVCLLPGGASSVAVKNTDLSGQTPGPPIVVGAGKCVTRNATYAGGQGVTIFNDAGSPPAIGEYWIEPTD